MKVLVAASAFKGSLNSIQAGKTISEALKEKGHQADFIPVSDGGDGFLDAVSFYKNLKTESIYCIGGLGKKECGQYAYDEKERTLYVEVAKSCGLASALKAGSVLDPYEGSTYGLGQIISLLKDQLSFNKVIMGLGGSCSIDLGVGFLFGLGASFFDKKGMRMKWVGNRELSQIGYMDLKPLEKYKGISFIGLEDCKAPLFGNKGAVSFYGPQKGAGKQDLDKLTANIRAFIKTAGEENTLIADKPGLGAAGGLPVALTSFLHGSVLSGIDEILKMADYDKIKDNYNLIITCEGCFDAQSLQGKASGELIRRGNKVIVICGSTTLKPCPDYVKPLSRTLQEKENSLAEPEKTLHDFVIRSF